MDINTGKFRQFPGQNGAFYTQIIDVAHGMHYLETRFKSKQASFFITKSDTIKTTQALAVGAAALLAYSLFRKSAGLGNLVFFPDKVQRLTFDGLTPVIVVGIGVQNTSNQSFTLKSLAGNAYSNDFLVGNIGSFIPQDIPANSQRILQVTIRMALIGVVNDIVDAFRFGNFKQALELRMYANIDNLQVPINIKYQVG